jgi:hypothetical protein
MHEGNGFADSVLCGVSVQLIRLGLTHLHSFESCKGFVYL